MVYLEDCGQISVLSAVLSMKLSVDEKLGIMETECGIPLNDKMREADAVIQGRELVLI